jgi:hypothetical protein
MASASEPLSCHRVAAGTGCLLCSRIRGCCRRQGRSTAGVKAVIVEAVPGRRVSTQPRECTLILPMAQLGQVRYARSSALNGDATSCPLRRTPAGAATQAQNAMSLDRVYNNEDRHCGQKPPGSTLAARNKQPNPGGARSTPCPLDCRSELNGASTSTIRKRPSECKTPRATGTPSLILPCPIMQLCHLSHATARRVYHGPKTLLRM